MDGVPAIESRLDRAFARQAARQPKGLAIHAFVAAGCLIAFAGPITALEIATIIAAGYMLLRLPTNFFLHLWGLLRPLPLLIIAWTAWLALSLLWTPDLSQGLDQFASNRWAGIIMYLLAVVAFRRRLVLALAVGFLLGNLAQALQFAFHDAAWMPWTDEPNRYAGWWNPAVGGSLLTAALGLHLPAAVMGKGRARLLALAAAAVTLAGILATGTRGAWLASAALIAVTIVVALVISPRRRAVLATAAALALAVAAAAFVFRAPIMNRVHEARAEIVGAFENQDYRSPTGARIAMAGWAVEAFAEHPIRGVGVGGYRAWVLDHLEGEGIDPATRSVHDHAHNAVLHIAATNGLVGLALAAAIALVAFRNAFAPLTRADLGSYAAAPGFALLGLLFVSAFDDIHINAQTAALLATLMALTPGYGPSTTRNPTSPKPPTSPAAPARGQAAQTRNSPTPTPE